MTLLLLQLLQVLVIAIAVAVSLLLMPQPSETALELAEPLARSFIQETLQSAPVHPTPRDQLLQGYTVLITGPTSGIGQGLATVLSQMGANVIGMGRSPPKLQALQQQGILKDFVTADLADLDQVATAANTLLESNITLDVIIANAGMHYGWTTFHSPQTSQGIEQLMGVNYVSHVLLIEKLTPLLLQSATRESFPPRVLYVNSFFHYAVHASDLVNTHTSSPPNNHPQPPSWINTNNTSCPHPFFRDQYVYGASKAALLLHAAHYARRYHGTIHVVSADPGWTATNLNGKPGALLHLPFQWMGFPVQGWGLQSILAALFATKPPEPSRLYYANARNYAILPNILNSPEWKALPEWTTHRGWVLLRDWFVVLQGFVLGFCQRQYTTEARGFIMPVASEIHNTTLQDQVYEWTQTLIQEWL